MHPSGGAHQTRRAARGRALGIIGALGVVWLLVCARLAGAQQPAPSPSPAPAPAVEERFTGLPEQGTWTFNLDAGLGAFGFANSLYTNAKPDPSGDLSDNWAESFVKPALSARFAVGDSEVYSKVSVVGERTFAAPPSLVGEEASSFQVEDLHFGWRSGNTVGSENLLDFSLGRVQYKLGHGFILWDGAGEGGSRGGFWSNARKAWQFAAIARVKPGNHTFEAFYLDRDEVPESESGTTLFGGNYELALGDKSTFGATYLKFNADPFARPERDGMNVFNVRAYTGISNFSFEGEYAREENGERFASTAWMAQAGYEFSGMGWKPKVSYRYAAFEGDDPATVKNEGFDSLLPGFYDWGTWWQGEIAGEYFLSNSNLNSHQVRLHVTPGESVSGGLMGFFFELDQPAALAPQVTSKDVAFEVDTYCDWKLNKAFTLSLVAAFADPKGAIEQAYGRTKTFAYGMAYIAYSY